MTANKALLAEKGNEIFDLAAEAGCEIGFEASVCGGIPVIRAIRDGLVGNRIDYLLGILNGTSNYILSKMSEEGVCLSTAPLRTRKLPGFAEADPTLDIEGLDASHKLCILGASRLRLPHFHGRYRKRRHLQDRAYRHRVCEGVRIQDQAAGGRKRRRRGNRGEGGAGNAARDAPHEQRERRLQRGLRPGRPGADPACTTERAPAADPTGSAVVSDIVDMAARKNGRRARPGMRFWAGERRIKRSAETVTSFYMRFKCEDRPGVLSRISGILADHGISISAVTQKGRKENEYVPVVMLTHEAAEGRLLEAKAEIDTLPFIEGESVHIRIEPGERS